MADNRILTPVKIVDEGTPANSANVDANGDLGVLAVAQPGVDIGDVTVADFDTALTDADDDIVAFAQTTLRNISLLYASDGVQWERLTSDGSGSLDVNVTLSLPTGSNVIGGVTLLSEETDNAAVSVGGEVVVVGLVFDDTTPVVVTEGDVGYQRMSADREAYVVTRDAAGNERGANVTAANELNVLASAQPGVDIGDVDVLSLPSDTFVAGDGAYGKGVLIQGDDGTDRHNILVDAQGHMQVDVLTGGGVSTPSSPVTTTATSAALAAGGVITLDGPESGGTTTTLRAVDVSASVPIKAVIQTVADGTGTDVVVLFGGPNNPIMWRTPHNDYLSTAHPTNAGHDGFSVEITNLDNNLAADVYVTLYTED